jgi:hypothetical protein
MTPSRWRAASACGTWLWWPCSPPRGLTLHGARVSACRWHTDWRRQGRSIRPEPTRAECLDEMTWPYGNTLRTFDPGGMMKLYGLCKTGSLGALVCGGVHQSRPYQRCSDHGVCDPPVSQICSAWQAPAEVRTVNITLQTPSLNCTFAKGSVPPTKSSWRKEQTFWKGGLLNRINFSQWWLVTNIYIRLLYRHMYK